MRLKVQKSSKQDLEIVETFNCSSDQESLDILKYEDKIIKCTF